MREVLSSNLQMKRIAIVGAGAVGCYYGCRMAEAGHDVRFLLRRDFEDVKRQGFRISSIEGDFQIDGSKAFQSAPEIGVVDLAVVAWKATANGYAKEVIGPLLHAKTRILTLQNGLGNVELLEGLFGEGRILGGLCFVGINRLTAGQISHTVGGMVTIGEPLETGLLPEMPAIFGTKVKVTLSEDLALAQWRKLIWNVPFNGLCVAEGGIDIAELLSLPGKEEEARLLMKEVQATAQALGHQIPDPFIENQVVTTRKMGAYKPSSMLDYVNGFPLEVEAIWGEPVRRAEERGLSVPRMSALYETLLRMDGER